MQLGLQVSKVPTSRILLSPLRWCQNIGPNTPGLNDGTKIIMEDAKVAVRPQVTDMTGLGYHGLPGQICESRDNMQLGLARVSL